MRLEIRQIQSFCGGGIITHFGGTGLGPVHGNPYRDLDKLEQDLKTILNNYHYSYYEVFLNGEQKDLFHETLLKCGFTLDKVFLNKNHYTKCFKYTITWCRILKKDEDKVPNKSTGYGYGGERALEKFYKSFRFSRAINKAMTKNIRKCAKEGGFNR